MPDYLLLVTAAANRVYADAAPRLMAAELRVLADAMLPGVVGDVVEVDVAGVPYLSVHARELTGQELTWLANLSALYALFRRHGDLLEPLRLTRLDQYPSDLVTIPKYQGKTNEQLTKLLLNVTAAATRHPRRLYDRSLTVLDPLCGRGTTLNQALTYGLDVTGVDLDRRDFEAYGTFLRTWLRSHRYKHQADIGVIRVDGKRVGYRLEVELAPDKETYRAGRTQHLRYLCTDTLQLDGLLRKASFDVIVADTPYGVQHGSHGDRLVRKPLGLLDAAMPGWLRVLRPGGAVGLAFNRHVAPRQELAALLQQHGLQVCTGPGYDGFRHRVDQSIDRDVVVARRG